uniref:Uncharacterized protein n=1 Tax=Arundo donax TaxID=35708 RepID=A0A0A9EA52_ARUDO
MRVFLLSLAAFPASSRTCRKNGESNDY